MKIDVNYNRVFPRYFFNEAKLLKCIGQIALKIHDNVNLPIEMWCPDYGIYPPKIGLIEELNALCLIDYPIHVGNRSYTFITTYNSKANYPLFLFHENVEHRVFNEYGQWHHEFLTFCKLLNSQNHEL